MKYYIPTSSLNFNNILSTESISPESFYECRKFGYSRWTPIPENGFPNVVLLYATPCRFDRPVSDVEDHPMLVEIYTDKQYPQLQDGVYYSDGTVYLNSLTDRFVFFNEADKRTALSLSDSSLESKVGRLYSDRIIVRDCVGHFPKVSAPDTVQNQMELVSDQIKNRTKGLLFGYYIGALLSCDKNSLLRINRYRQLQSIFAAVLSSPDHAVSSSQKAAVEKIFREIEVEDPVYVKLMDAVGGSAALVDRVLCALRDLGKNVLDINPSRIMADLSFGDVASNRSMLWVKSSIDSIKATMRSRRKYLSVDDNEIMACDGRFEMISSTVLPDPDDNAIFVSWVKDVLSQSQYTGKVSSVKVPLADALTKKAREILGDRWENSNQRAYLNKLRRHIGGEPFAELWDNGLLSSIAAVLLKGDSWDTLVLFMQSKGMTDYRLALAFFGALNGFANLTRDFTDLLFNADSRYLNALYREFFGQLHSITIQEEKIQYDDGVFVSKASSPARELSESTASEQHSGSLSFDILKFFDSKDFKVKASKTTSREALRNGLSLAIGQLKDRSSIEELLSLLVKRYASYGWKKTTAPWKQLQEKFAPSFSTRGKDQGLLPGMEQPVQAFSGSILDYNDWISDCLPLINADSINCFTEDIKYFVKSRERNPDPKFSSLVSDKSNSAVLARLKAFLESQRDTTNPNQINWRKPEIYKGIPIDEIIKKLKSKYGC